MADFVKIFYNNFSSLDFYLIGFRNFIQLVSFTGGVFLALEAIFIMLMWLKMKMIKGVVLLKLVPKLIVILLIIFFVIVLINEIWRFSGSLTI